MVLLMERWRLLRLFFDALEWLLFLRLRTVTLLLSGEARDSF